MRNYTELEINEIIKNQKDIPGFNDENISDGWHTFKELYYFRKIYNACLFNEWAKPLMDQLKYEDLPEIYQPKYNVHKSWKHNDGEFCFGNEKKWFIVCAMLPSGLISNHYKAEDWDLFNIPQTEKALFEFDGHTGIDVLKRLTELCLADNTIEK